MNSRGKKINASFFITQLQLPNRPLIWRFEDKVFRSSLQCCVDTASLQWWTFVWYKRSRRRRRVSGQRGLGLLVIGRVSDVCLVRQAPPWSLACMSLSVWVHVSICPVHTAQCRGLRVGTPEEGSHVHWSIWQCRELYSVDVPLCLTVSGLAVWCCCVIWCNVYQSLPLVCVLARFVTVTGSTVCTLPRPSGHRHRGT